MTSRREFIMQAVAGGVLLTAPLRAGLAVERNKTRRIAGVVQTVLGPIPASKLGVTLPHEHICVGSPGLFETWPELFGGRALFTDKVVAKLIAAKEEGVQTIVDVTPADIGRNIRLLAEVSRRSGVNIITCTGHWLIPSLSMEARTVEELTDFFLLEIERGIDGTNIKPGVIKVATDHDGVTPFLERALRAAARASKASGIPVTTHTNAKDRTADKQADIFESENLNPTTVCLGHCDDSNDMDYLTGLLERGYRIGMDHMTWGVDSAKDVDPEAGLSWQQRAECVKKLVDAGYAQQIFLSNDWYFGASVAPSGFIEKMERMNPDGMLFTTRRIVPHLKKLGVSEEAVHLMTVDNPRRFFGGI